MQLSEKEIPITITGNARCTCHTIQERTLNGSVNVCISNWIRKPVITQSAYIRLKSNGIDNAVSEAEDLDSNIEMYTPMGILSGRKKTKLTLYRGNGKRLPALPGNQVTIVCIIVTGIQEKIDTILPRRYYNDMRLRFMRRVVGGEWKTLWGQLYIGQSNQENFHVYHTEEHESLDDLSDVWSYTRLHRFFYQFVPLVDKKGVNYPVGLECPPENYEWFTTLLMFAVRGSLYRDLRQLMKENPNWDLDPPAVHGRVAVPRKYNINKWASHGLIRNLVDDTTAPLTPEEQNLAKSLIKVELFRACFHDIDNIKHASSYDDLTMVDVELWKRINSLPKLRKVVDAHVEKHPELSALCYGFVDFVAHMLRQQPRRRRVLKKFP